MKGLTMTQPWASLVAIGENRIETRSWQTGYRGAIAIHAAKAFPSDARRLCRRWPYRETLAAAGYEDAGSLPLGAVIAVAELEQVMAFDSGSLAEVRARSARGELPAHDADFGDFAPGRFGFVLRDVRALATPVPARGMLGLWQVSADLEQRIMDAAGRS
jgi:hypothetical protein